MNANLWMPSVATALNKSRSFAARPLAMLERVRAIWKHANWQHANAPASSSVDVRFKGARPDELWSSALTRAIHHVEDDIMLLIMVFFAGGMLAILFGW